MKKSPEQMTARVWLQVDLWEWIPKIQVLSDNIGTCIVFKFLFFEAEFVLIDRDAMLVLMDEIAVTGKIDQKEFIKLSAELQAARAEAIEDDEQSDEKE